jgi:hypothetical protein
VTAIPTRWRTTFEEQLTDAARRVKAADAQLAQDNGGRALQEAYPAVVAAATVRIWIAEPPWRRALSAGDMQRRVREAFPSLFAALAALDLKDVLNSPWPTESARPYVDEARTFVNATQQELESWLARG